MVQPNTQQESVVTDQSEKANLENVQFDVDKALDKKGFAEFLAAHPDVADFDMSDSESIQSRFETFQVKESVSKGLQNLFRNQIRENLGVKLDSSDLRSIDAHLQELAIENPEEILGLQKKLTVFQEMPGQIKELETQLATLGNSQELSAKLESLKTDKRSLESVEKYSGFWGRLKMGFQINFCRSLEKSRELEGHKQSLEIAKDRFDKLDSDQAGLMLVETNKQIEEVNKTLETISKVEGWKVLAQEMFNNSRKNLLEGIVGISGITESIKRRAMAQMESALASGKLRILDQAEQDFTKLQKASESLGFGIDVLDGKEEDLRSRLDTATENAIGTKIHETISNVKLGEGAMTRLERSLEQLIGREKIGSKVGVEAREFVVQLLGEIVEQLDTSLPGIAAKKLMCARIIGKLTNK